MSWENKVLSDISISIQTGPFGSQLHQSDYSETGTPVVMPKDLINGKISEESIARVSQDHVDRLSKHKICAGDILYSRRGDVGRCAYATEKEADWLCGTGCLKVTIDTNKAIPSFVFYQLQKAEIVGWVVNHAVGSTMLNLNTSILSSVPIELPEMEIQRKIVDYISAYDALIENNQKQIKLLEEAAQRLYKEWFIDLRFPGYEDVEIVDDIPNGWRNAQLGDVIDINKENISKNYSYDHIDYIDISSVRTGAILNTNFYALADAPGRAKRCIHDGDVIWGMVRPNLKSYALIMNPTNTMIASTGFAVLTPKNIPFTFLYCIVTQEAFVGYLINCTNGAAYPAVKPIHFQQSPVLIPTDELLNQFHLITEPLFRKIDTLHMQVNILTEARDRLLPKLMNGLIEI